MRKIALVTSTRAEYGIMNRLIEALSNDKDVDFYLLVTGMHLSEKFGMTKNEITQKIYKEVDIEIEKEPAHSLALAIEKFDKVFKEIKPDLTILLGDRYEIMGIAQSCMLNNIPIAHLSGGDKTEGAIDEAIRHSITKMSHLHFPSCTDSAKRIIQLGEQPDRVFDIGDLAIENIKKLTLLPKEELENSLGFKFNKKNILLTYHPVTLETNSKEQFKEILDALETLKDTNIIITYPNSDSGSEEIIEQIKEFEKTHTNAKSYISLGMKRYFSCLKHVDIVMGNSSSGIYEVPSFGIPTINIGNRQKGRLQATSIINCSPQKDEILKAIQKCYCMDFTNTQNLFEKKDTLQNMINILKTVDLTDILKKDFYDIQ